MIEEQATGRLKERLKELGLIINLGASKVQPQPRAESKRPAPDMKRSSTGHPRREGD